MTLVLLIYLAALLALSVRVSSQVTDVNDYLLAGRRLGLALSWATLFSTWFGAGTLLTAADEVAKSGVAAAALEPLGPGVCLLLAGFLVARPLRRLELTTIADLFGMRYGRLGEASSALILASSYFGWIAVQFVSLAKTLDRLAVLSYQPALWLTAGVGTAYTLIGGMWSVTLTDAVQVTLLLSGLSVLGLRIHRQHGTSAIVRATLTRAAGIPRGAQPWIDWTTAVLIGALGNLPGQDLLQRVFAARSEQVAQRACWLAGAAYLFFGALPVLIGLTAAQHSPELQGQSVVVASAQQLLGPISGMLFILGLVSAVLSTIDSAILSPSALLAQNIFGRVDRQLDTRRAMRANRLAVVAVAAISMLMALYGESAYTLLEQAYVLPLVGLLVPLLIATYWPQAASPRRGVLAIIGGTSIWLTHELLGWRYLLGPLSQRWRVKMPTAIGAPLVASLSFLLPRARPALADEQR